MALYRREVTVWLESEDSRELTATAAALGRACAREERIGLAIDSAAIEATAYVVAVGHLIKVD